MATVQVNDVIAETKANSRCESNGNSGFLASEMNNPHQNPWQKVQLNSFLKT